MRVRVLVRVLVQMARRHCAAHRDMLRAREAVEMCLQRLVFASEFGILVPQAFDLAGLLRRAFFLRLLQTFEVFLPAPACIRSLVAACLATCMANIRNSRWAKRLYCDAVSYTSRARGASAMPYLALPLLAVDAVVIHSLQ